jgi:STAS domain
MAGPAQTTIVLDVRELPPDVRTIDALARFQLAARRRGQRLRLRAASDDLRSLIAFVGLGDVLREPRREGEQREELPGVEEERELDDPAS